MKKTLIIFSSILLLGCTSTNDLIYSQDETLSLTTDLDQSVLNSHSKLLANSLGEVTLMDIVLDKPVAQPEGGGCSFKAGHSVDNIYTSTAAFGPNPMTFFGYTFRGYGKPRTDSFNWKGIRFKNDNRPKTIINRGVPMTTNDPMSNAISIEFPFQANATYQITLTAWIEDFIYSTKHDRYEWDDDNYDVDSSEGFPTVAVELSSSPEINGDNPCAQRPFVQASPFVSRNYFKSQKAIISKPLHEIKELTFNFTMNEAKNAVIIYFMPEVSEGRTAPHIPKNAFEMYLNKIKIIQKPYDPSHIITPNVPCSNSPGGFRCP